VPLITLPEQGPHTTHAYLPNCAIFLLSRCPCGRMQSREFTFQSRDFAEIGAISHAGRLPRTLNYPRLRGAVAQGQSRGLLSLVSWVRIPPASPLLNISSSNPRDFLLRQYLLEKSHHRCAYCAKTNAPLEIEHIIPRSRHGSDRVSNLAIACHDCNHQKGRLLARTCAYLPG
jgi:hypothetical protein